VFNSEQFYSPDLQYFSLELQKKIHTISTREFVPKNNLLINYEDIPGYIYFVHSGMFEVIYSISDGKELIIKIACPDDILIGTALFTKNVRCSFSVKALQDSVVGRIERKELEYLLKNNGKYAVEWLTLANHTINMDFSRFLSSAFHDKKHLLYQMLYFLAMKHGIKTASEVKINVPLTNKRLANLTGVARENVNRILGDLRKQNKIHVKNGFITILDITYFETTEGFLYNKID